MFTKNFKDMWSTIEGASEDILGYFQDIWEIKGQILQRPAKHWKMSCRSLAGHPPDTLGYLWCQGGYPSSKKLQTSQWYLVCERSLRDALFTSRHRKKISSAYFLTMWPQRSLQHLKPFRYPLHSTSTPLALGKYPPPPGGKSEVHFRWKILLVRAY